MAREYTQGDVVQFEVQFRDPTAAGRPLIDPSTVSFTFRAGSSASSTPIDYTSATVPAVGVLARVGIGRYQTWVDTTDFGGCYLQVEWISTGTGQATAAPSPAYVRARPI